MRKNKSYIGVNLTHDSSVCQVTNGKIDWFAEEERFSRVKHDSFPSLALLNMDINSIDNKLQISGLYEPHNKDKFKNDAKSFCTQAVKKYTSEIAVGKIYKEVIQYEFYLQHHDFHCACGFYNSGFPRAAAFAFFLRMEEYCQIKLNKNKTATIISVEEFEGERSVNG